VNHNPNSNPNSNPDPNSNTNSISNPNPYPKSNPNSNSNSNSNSNPNPNPNPNNSFEKGVQTPPSLIDGLIDFLVIALEKEEQRAFIMDRETRLMQLKGVRKFQSQD
jgi:hypothetical protein